MRWRESSIRCHHKGHVLSHAAVGDAIGQDKIGLLKGVVNGRWAQEIARVRGEASSTCMVVACTAVTLCRSNCDNERVEMGVKQVKEGEP
jgi:hypothetical protein